MSSDRGIERDSSSAESEQERKGMNAAPSAKRMKYELGPNAPELWADQKKRMVNFIVQETETDENNIENLFSKLKVESFLIDR